MVDPADVAIGAVLGAAFVLLMLVCWLALAWRRHRADALENREALARLGVAMRDDMEETFRDAERSVMEEIRALDADEHRAVMRVQEGSGNDS